MAKREETKRVVLESRYVIGIETEHADGTISLDEIEDHVDVWEARAAADGEAAKRRLDYDDRT